MMVDPESALPLYAQVKDILGRQIRGGTYQAHQALPAERDLVDRFGVSRITVRRALAELVGEGLLYRRVGRGTFVAAEPIVGTLTELTGHLEELIRRNLHPEVRLVESAQIPTPVEAAVELGGSREVLFVRRVVSVEGAPLLVLDICVPADLGMRFAPQALTVEPINRLLEAQGFHPVSGEQRIRARAVEETEALLLEVEPGTPVLEVTRTERTIGERGLLWSRAVYRGDRYQYVIRLHRRRSLA